MSTLSARDVGVRLSGRWIIDGVDAEVTPGELLVVLGPNGAGKSTLLAALAGDRPVDRGRVDLDGEDLNAMPLREIAARRAVVGPPAPLAFDFTVRDVVAMGWRSGERYGKQAEAAALDAVLDECSLVALADRIYMTLSSGERQRAQFARGLLQIWRPPGDTSPRWLLLDEPTSNLDIAHSIGLLASLRKQARDGIGVLAIVHDLDLGARFADRVILLADGRIAAAGEPDDVFTSNLLSDVYGTPVHVEYHAGVDRLVVLT
ncbi:MAG: heme ABC transporter ATP-binding protein [Pseudomonadota bacterium]